MTLIEQRFKEAIEKGNRSYWGDNFKQETALKIWQRNNCQGEGPNYTHGSIIDYIHKEVMETLKTLISIQ